MPMLLNPFPGTQDIRAALSMHAVLQFAAVLSPSWHLTLQFPWCIFGQDQVFCLQNGEQVEGGCMIPPGLTPHAAAALQFWLSQGALNPHMHASYLHSLQGPFGEPLGHQFSGRALQRASLILLLLWWECFCCAGLELVVVC